MPKFHVVRVTAGGEITPLMEGENPLVMPNAQEAQRIADYYTNVTRVKHQPRPISENVDWRKRELERFESGHYVHVPWHKEKWVGKNKDCADHFVHVGKTPSNVAFTPNAEKAILDAHVAMKPSKYLASYYGEILSEDEIRQWIAKYKKEHDKDAVLYLATTAKDIVRVYRNGPNSCMGGDKRFYTKVHPASCYEGPDLAVAYAQRSGRIVARSVVWPAKKLYSRFYGDEAFLAELLHEEGYQKGSLRGARMTKIKEGNRYVCPYIDYEGYVHIGIKWMRIGQGKRHSRFAQNADGYCGRGFNCALCATMQDADKVIFRPCNGQNACELCINKAVIAGTIGHCFYHNQYFSIDRLTRLHDNSFMYRDVFWERGFTCGECGKNYPARTRDFLRPNTAKLGLRNRRGWQPYTGTCVSCPVQADMGF